MKFKPNKMNWLDKKIPPPIVAIFFAVLMKFLAPYGPSISMPETFNLILCSAITIVALVVDISAILSFKKMQTTVNPLKPSSATQLVVNGVYHFSRNPMYLGMVLLLSAWGIYLSSLFGLFLILGFVFYITRFQIRPEERALTKLFTTDFINYKQTVRRWL